MSKQMEAVIDLCNRLDEGMEGVRAAFRHHFLPHTVWDNVGVAVTTGPEEAIKLWEAMEKMGFLRVRVEILNIVEAANAVLTERIDHCIGPDGEEVLGARLMGVFRFEGDKVSRWDDYTDPAVVARLGAMQHLAIA
jgi:limonene-1,2-epoxide hydrolase